MWIWQVEGKYSVVTMGKKRDNRRLDSGRSMRSGGVGKAGMSGKIGCVSQRG